MKLKGPRLRRSLQQDTQLRRKKRNEKRGMIFDDLMRDATINYCTSSLTLLFYIPALAVTHTVKVHDFEQGEFMRENNLL